MAAYCLGQTAASAQGASASEETPSAKLYRRPIIEATVCQEPPVLDGVLDDACWRDAYRTDEFWNTDDRCAPGERTEAWLCVDDMAFYVAVYAHDSEPQSIKCQETKRGGDISNDDFISLALDPDHSADHFYIFQATANGTQKESIPGGSDAKIEWRGDWSAAARILDDGWTVEMRIPHRILRYPAGQSVWGVDIWRRHARTSNWFKWPPQPEHWDDHEIAELRGLKLPVIQARPIVMPNVQSEWDDGHFRTNLSVDTKYTHASGLSGVLSWMPDFRNIEDEVESIDFSYTERWYQDRRPFFAEGGGYMPPDEMFYSRRIPDFDLGLKAFGTVDRTSIGLLDAHSFGDRNDLALHVDQRIAQHSGAALAYVRTDRSDVNNQTYYAHAHYRKLLGRGSFSVRGDLFESDTEGGSSGTSWAIELNRRRGKGKPGFWARYRHVDPTFDPQNGFAPETDLEGLSGGIDLSNTFEQGRMEAQGSWLSLGRWDHTDGSPYHNDLGAGYWTPYRDGLWWDLNWAHSDRPPHLDQTWWLFLGWNSKKLHRGGSLTMSWGQQAGADYLFYSLEQGVKLSERLRFRIGYEHRESDYPDDTADERVRRATVTANYDFTPEKTLGGRLLSGTSGTNFYMSYRQAVRRGTDFFVILGDPNADRTESRLAVKTKWVYR